MAKRSKKSRLHGKNVKKSIVKYYEHKKHYPAKRAKLIAGAVAYNIHQDRKHSHKKKRR